MKGPDAHRGLSREGGRLVYEPDGEKLALFLEDRSHVSIIRGPIGSGTSSACCMKIYWLAREQPLFNGKRRSAWAVVRDSYPNLRATTIKTWLEWFPENEYGRFYYDRPFRHPVRFEDVELDVTFLSLDSDDDIKKLKSNEFTGFWFNELEYTSKAIFDEAESRSGRWPSIKVGGCTWDGVIADMNAPNEDHWLPQMMGEVPIPPSSSAADILMKGKPANWNYLVQPPALLEIRSPDGRQVVGYKTNLVAENLKWLKPGFYEEKMQGKTKAWIDSRLRNEIVYVIDGTPVFTGFNQDTHIAGAELVPVPGAEVIVGVDFGRNRPAAVFMQVINNRIFIQHEFRAYGQSASVFAPALKRFMEEKYPGEYDPVRKQVIPRKYRMYGDPKGADKSQTDGRTPYEIFDANGLKALPAPGIRTNSPVTRIAAVDDVLNGSGAMYNGLPRFVLSPVNCPTLKAAMCGRYRIKKDSNGDPEPVKDEFSDVADALQYAFLGLGEGRRMIGLEPLHDLRPVMVYRGSGRRSSRLGARRVR
jgi:hypothetical protein